AIANDVDRSVVIGAGRAGPIRHARLILRNDIAQGVVEQCAHALLDVLALRRRNRLLESLAIVPGFPAGLDLVVAAPQHDAGMVAQTLYLLHGLDAHVVAERLVGRW